LTTHSRRAAIQPRSSRISHIPVDRGARRRNQVIHRSEKAQPLNASTRPLWLAVIILVSLMIGVAAGTITWFGNSDPYTAILAGGSTFGGCVLLLLAMAAYLTAGS
jgi:hypothetical protein